MFAISAFLSVFQNLCILSCIFHQVYFFVLDNFLIPIIFYVQISLITFAMLKILYFGLAKLKFLFIFLIPALLLALSYLLLYCTLSEGPFFSEDRYVYFSETDVAYTICLIIYITVVTAIPICICFLFLALHYYEKRLVWFFSGQDAIEGRNVGYLVYFVIAYVFLSTVDFISSNEKTDPALTIICSLFYFALVLIICRKQYQFFKSSPLSSMPINTPSIPESSASQGLDFVVKGWIRREDRPFLKEGITLADVAEDVNIRTDLLCAIINTVYHKNFDNWINDLRLDVVRDILESEPNMPISHIAANTGFVSKRTLVRIFRKSVGMTPSAYRGRLGK
jgi:AraC-like DNA-binding protein